VLGCHDAVRSRTPGGSARTVARHEGRDGGNDPCQQSVDEIRKAREDGGVTFLDQDEVFGVGVRFSERAADRLNRRLANIYADMEKWVATPHDLSPDEWRLALQMFDEMSSMSDQIRQTYQRLADGLPAEAKPKASDDD